MGKIHKCESCTYEIYIGIPALFMEHELHKIMREKHPELKEDSQEYAEMRQTELDLWTDDYFKGPNRFRELPDKCPMCGKGGFLEGTSFN